MNTDFLRTITGCKCGSYIVGELIAVGESQVVYALLDEKTGETVNVLKIPRDHSIFWLEEIPADFRNSLVDPERTKRILSKIKANYSELNLWTLDYRFSRIYSYLTMLMTQASTNNELKELRNKYYTFFSSDFEIFVMHKYPDILKLAKENANKVKSPPLNQNLYLYLQKIYEHGMLSEEEWTILLADKFFEPLKERTQIQQFLSCIKFCILPYKNYFAASDWSHFGYYVSTALDLSFEREVFLDLLLNSYEEFRFFQDMLTALRHLKSLQEQRGFIKLKVFEDGSFFEVCTTESYELSQQTEERIEKLISQAKTNNINLDNLANLIVEKMRQEHILGLSADELSESLKVPMSCILLAVQSDSRLFILDSWKQLSHVERDDLPNELSSFQYHILASGNVDFGLPVFSEDARI